MADQLYLSLWFPNFRLDALPAALISVMRQFARISQQDRVAASAAYPIGFNEPPVYQRLFVNDERSEDNPDSTIQNAVAEATEQLHDDTAYEFEMAWRLWSPSLIDGEEGLETGWTLQPSTVRFFGFGPQFDDAGYEQNGHIRVDFGLDTPWILEETEMDDETSQHIQQNIEMLLAFTLSIEKHCGISSRLLWTESGEPLAEKLIARLQRLN